VELVREHARRICRPLTDVILIFKRYCAFHVQGLSAAKRSLSLQENADSAAICVWRVKSFHSDILNKVPAPCSREAQHGDLSIYCNWLQLSSRQVLAFGKNFFEPVHLALCNPHIR
jgi:hypothetical protein